MRVPRIALVAAGLLVVATTARAQGGPPMLTDDPGTVPARGWEVNTAFTVEALGRDRTFEAPLIDANYGLASHLQLKLEGPLLLATAPGQTRSALGNLSLGVKWRFIDQHGSRGVDVSTYPAFGFRVPLGGLRRELNDPVPQLQLPIQVAHSFGRFALNADAGYQIRRALPDEVSAGLAAGFTPREGWEWIAEVHHAREPRASERESYANLGLRHELREGITLLASGGRSLGRAPAIIGYLGLQFSR
jgi:hypothetical protein